MGWFYNFKRTINNVKDHSDLNSKRLHKLFKGKGYHSEIIENNVTFFVELSFFSMNTNVFATGNIILKEDKVFFSIRNYLFKSINIIIPWFFLFALLQKSASPIFTFIIPFLIFIALLLIHSILFQFHSRSLFKEIKKKIN